MGQITRQKGVSNSQPSWLRRFIISRILQRAGSLTRLNKQRKRREIKRASEKRRHVVEYFHQVDDGHAFLSIQILKKLKEAYDIDFVIHLLPARNNINFPEPELWRDFSLIDASQIAPYYGLEPPTFNELVTNHAIEITNQLLTRLSVEEFIDVGPKINACLLKNDINALQKWSEIYGLASPDELQKIFEQAEKRLKQIKHFGSANFWYEGESYWKIDRVYHLENRLTSLDAVKLKTTSLLYPPKKPTIKKGSLSKSFTLEYFVSLRSPYTAISWQPTMDLIEASGVELKVRPVLPMVMRGVPATFDKGVYFWLDCAREAYAKGVGFRKFYDPIGDPVIKGYQLYFWAERQQPGSGNIILEQFLKAAFYDGINTNTQNGIRTIVERSGFAWSDTKYCFTDDSWQQALENNRTAMYEFGNWGVPAYRLLDDDGNELCHAWGQDRLWYVAQKITEQS